MCKEFPETSKKLTAWADWRRKGNNLKQLGYPSSASHTKPFGGSGFEEVLSDPVSENIDRFIGQLSKKYSDIHEVLMSKYFYGDNDRDGSVNCCISKTMYQSYLKIGVSWIDGRLAGLD